jgi:hypothetical protein
MIFNISINLKIFSRKFAVKNFRRHGLLKKRKKNEKMKSGFVISAPPAASAYSARNRGKRGAELPEFLSS